MSGDDRVTNRIHLSPLARAFLTIAAFSAIIDTFNIFTAIHDAAEHGKRLAAWEPAVWEYTSGVSTLLTCGIIYGAIRIAPPGRTRWPKFLFVHASASLLFSGLHVVLMNAMRVAIYLALGKHYQFGEAGFWYEYRKDVVAYVIWATIFWFFTQRRTPSPTTLPIERRTIDILDGKRLLRVPVDEIAAVRAAGNYVEFMLTDGRRPLARKSLADAHREFAGEEFVRTHRSWVVKVSHVRELRPVGAGDYEIQLDGDIQAPLSRRFPEALATLLNPRA
ncbi:MAG TPA: LytTR family DNA-binding domain-containing protein [Sphingomicrobium sp.]|nr:LytTR family DNA-binding domain-containing protein [Sphingomicrobium sp.]